jgi:hypothetical protein
MNKLINDFNRGYSLKNDDLRFIDAAIRLAFDDIVKSLGGSSPRVLWGCALIEHGTYISITEGAIYFQGEIWHVYPHNLIVAIPRIVPIYWVFMTEFDAAGAKLDKDLVSHDTYQKRFAVSSLTSNPAGSVGSLVLAPAPGPSADTTPPAAVTGLGYTIDGSGYVVVTWPATSDNVAVTGYEIFVSYDSGAEALYGSTSSLIYYIGGVESGQNLTIRIKAYDAAGNRSAFSAPLLVAYP